MPWSICSCVSKPSQVEVAPLRLTSVRSSTGPPAVRLPRSTGLRPATSPPHGDGDRPVDGQVVEVQADHLIVAGQRGSQYLLTGPGLGPVVEAAADGAVRAARGGDAFVPAAVYQGGDDVVEHQPV